MKIVLTTHAREPSYLDATLDTLFATELTITCVHVLLHELETQTTCLGRWADDPRIKIRSLTPEEHNAKMKLGRRVRVAHATRLALEMADDECILLQDDADFQIGWLKTFEKELDAFGPNRTWSMISLCTHLRHQIKDGILPWNPASYWGLVAMYFGNVARQKAIEALGKWEITAGPSPGMGADVCLKVMLESSRDVRLFARYPSLVNHTGLVSSIASSPRKREAPTFKKPRPPVSFPGMAKGQAGTPPAKKGPVTFPTKGAAHPVAPTPSAVQHPATVTTKQRKNPNAPVKFTKRP